MGQENLNYLRDHLLDHEVSINSEELWKEISTKKKKIYYQKMASLGLLFLAAITFLWIMYSNTDKGSIHSGTINEHAQILNAEKSVHSDNFEPNFPTTNGKDTESEIAHTKLNRPDSHSDSPVIKSESAFDDSNKNVMDDNYSAHITPPIISANFNLISTVELYENESKHSSTAHSIQDPKTTRDIKSTNLIQHLSLLKRSDIALFTDKFDMPAPPGPKGIDCYDHSGKKMDLYLLGYTGIDFVSPSMTASEEFESYLDERKTSQKQLLAYKAGLQLKHLSENGLYFKGGLEYGIAREKFEYRKTTQETVVLPDQLIEINIDINGDTTLIYGNAPVTIIEMKNWKVSNNYKSFGVHILAGYQLDQGNFVYGFEAGVQYNLNLKFSGMLLNDQLDPIVASDYFKSSSKLSLLGGFNLGYRLNNYWTVFSSLNYLGNLSTINKASNLVNQKNRHMGLSVGLEYKL